MICPCGVAMGWRTGLVLLALLVTEGVSLNLRGPSPGRDVPSWSSSRHWLSGSHSQVGIVDGGPWVSSGGPARARALTPLRPVTLQCQEVNMVLTVQRDLFGTGKLIQAADLRLGAAFCGPTSLNADNTVTFQVALQECGNTLQVTPDFLVYSSVLTYSPSLSSSSKLITRTNQASVLVQCIYPRHSNVSSKAIKPTWIPFSSTVYAEESLAFSLRLMTDDWSAQRTSNTFQLGDVFSIEASVQTGSHVAMRVFVDSCVATLSPDKTSSPRYDIVAASGCLVDSKIADASAFISPRTQPDQLQFTVDAFRFIGDPKSTVYITCDLKAVAVGSEPNSIRKACSFKGSNGWVPVEGPSSICSCCKTTNCVLPVGRTMSFYPPGVPRRFERRGESTTESREIAIGPLVVLDGEAPPLEDRLEGYVFDQPYVEESRSVLESQAEYFAALVQDEQHFIMEDGHLEPRSEAQEPLKMVELQSVQLGQPAVLDGVPAIEDTTLLEAPPKDPQVLQSQIVHLAPQVVLDPIPLGLGHTVLMEAQGGEPLIDLTVRDGYDHSGLTPGVGQDPPHVNVPAEDPRGVLGLQVVPVVVLEEEHRQVSATPSSAEFQVVEVGRIAVLGEHHPVSEESRSMLDIEVVTDGPVELLDDQPVLEHRQMLKAHVEPIRLDEELRPVNEERPTTDFLESPEPRSMLGLQVVDIGPVVVLDESRKVLHVEPSVSDERYSVSDEPTIRHLESSDPRRILETSQEVHLVPIVVLDGSEHTSVVEASKSKQILKSESLVQVGPIMVLDHLVSGEPQLDAETTRMELQVVASPPLAEEHSLDIPRTFLFKSQQGAHTPGMTPPLPSGHLPPLVVLNEQPLPSGEEELHRELIEEKSKVEEYKSLEAVLMIVAGAVLVCMLVLGGFLVYRRRVDSFV